MWPCCVFIMTYTMSDITCGLTLQQTELEKSDTLPMNPPNMFCVEVLCHVAWLFCVTLLRKLINPWYRADHEIHCDAQLWSYWVCLNSIQVIWINQDMTSLSELNEACVLSNIRDRYESDLIYVSIYELFYQRHRYSRCALRFTILWLKNTLVFYHPGTK